MSHASDALVNELRAENARLRQELAIREASEQEKVIEYLRQENVDWEDKYRALAKENGELRKLCADLRFCRRHNCLTCSHGRFCDMGFDERFAKLNVEVPDE